MTTTLPSDFVWGAAASAFQIEGATLEDGRGESIWDRFCATPGKVRAGDTGETACDFYHRYPDDIELMAGLGIDAFRFSIAWPRVLPDGRGSVNERGLDFYDRLVDALLEAEIRPYVNLYHWDLPQPLEDEGGWRTRSTAEAFAEYADVVGARLGDRVRDWVTHNEPFCSSWLGYGMGIHAPGGTSEGDALAAAHHVLLSHGLALDVLRGRSPGSEVGIVLDSWPIHPATEDHDDIAAATAIDGLATRWFFEAVLLGAYPADVLERFAYCAPEIRNGDMATIAAPIDFLGVNNYSRRVVRAGKAGRAIDVKPDDAQFTDMGWEIYPRGLGEVLERAHAWGAPSLYVTENGAAFSDVRTHDGRVHDVERIDYLRSYLDEVALVVEAGVPVRGYFVWSLLDNFEWALGYAKRFGIVHVDYPTLERTPKDSYFWLRDRIAGTRSGRGARHGARASLSSDS